MQKTYVQCQLHNCKSTTPELSAHFRGQSVSCPSRTARPWGGRVPLNHFTFRPVKWIIQDVRQGILLITKSSGGRGRGSASWTGSSPGVPHPSPLTRLATSPPLRSLSSKRHRTRRHHIVLDGSSPSGDGMSTFAWKGATGPQRRSARAGCEPTHDHHKLEDASPARAKAKHRNDIHLGMQWHSTDVNSTTHGTCA